MTEKSINNALMQAVSYCDVETVKACLEKGADPNYTIFKDEEEPNGIIQPTTPLRMVMFRISDAMLKEEDFQSLEEITRLLLKYGADPKPAMQIAEARYGRYDPDEEDTPFMKIWHIIAQANS